MRSAQHRAEPAVAARPTERSRAGTRQRSVWLATRPFEALDKSIGALIPPGHDDDTASILQRVRTGERVDDFETTRSRKDGMQVDVSVTVSPICDPAGSSSAHRRSPVTSAHDCALSNSSSSSQSTMR